jgi:hypothetical protein
MAWVRLLRRRLNKRLFFEAFAKGAPIWVRLFLWRIGRIGQEFGGLDVVKCIENVETKPLLNLNFFRLSVGKREMWLALREDHCLVGVREDAVVEVPADRSGENEALKVATFLNKIR